jgi:hypothetical protein
MATPKPVTYKIESAPTTGKGITPLKGVTTGVANQANQAYANYQNSEAYQNAQRMQNATINDIAKKYGFDYSREYANRQAEAEAQAKRNAYNANIRQNDTLNKQNLTSIRNDVREGNTALDHNFMTDYLAQRQAQANRGMNAGITAEADLRLGMNQQAQMANIYRDAALARSKENDRYGNESLRLNEALALVEQERLAYEDRLYQDGLQRGFQNLNSERQYGLELDRNEWGKTQDLISRYFDLGEMDMNRIKSETEYSGLYNGNKTAEQLMRDFNMDMERKKFAHQQAMDNARLALQRQQAAAAAAAARTKYDTSQTTPSGSANQMVQAYNKAKEQTAGGTSAAAQYAQSVSANINQGRSVVRKPIEDLDITKRFLPNLGNPMLDPALDPYTRNKIRLGL